LLADGNLGAELGSLAANDGGTLAAGRDLRLEVSGPFAGRGGTLAAGGNLDLSLPAVSFDAATAGSFESGGRFSLDVLGFANAGTWRPSAASVSVRATAAFSNAGDIEAAGDLLATAGTSFDNAGRLFAAGALDLGAPQLSNQGELLAGGNLVVNAATTNRGAIAAVGNVALSGAALDNAGGRTQSDRNLSIDVAGALDNVGGTLAALGNADLRAGRILNDRAAPTGTVSVSRGRDAALLDGLVLLADPRVILADLSPDHAAGTVLVAGDPALGTTDRLVSLPETVRTESSQAHGAAGRILVLGDAAIRAEGPMSNRGGEILAGGSLTLAASALDNGRSADLINGTTIRTDPTDLARFVAELNAARGAGLSFQSGTDPATGDPVFSTVPAYASNPATAGTPAVTPGIGGSVQAGGAAALTVGSLIQQGTLTAGGSMTVDSAGTLDNTGTIAVAGDLSVRSASLSNTAGARLLAGRDLSLDIAGTLLNQSAVIEAGRDLAIAAGAVRNLDAGQSTTGRSYRVDTPAGYQDDKWLTYAEYAAGVEALVADPAARAKLLAPEYLADYANYEGSHRIRLAGPTDFYMDSGLTEPTFDFTFTRRDGRATITAGRNLDLSAGSLTNEASLINAGADLTARIGALSNNAAADEYRLLISAGEWSEYRVYVPAAAALQAGASLSVAAAGSIVNTGNVLGQAIALSGSELTNGITDPRIPPITSTQPGAAIPLLPPNLGTPPAPRTGTPMPSQDHDPLVLPRVGETGGASPPPLAGDLLAPRNSSGTRFLHTSPASSALAPLGPDYLLSLLPAELANGRDLLFLADPAVEQQLLREAALQETGRAWFIDGLAYDDQLQVSADTQQRAALYEAAARFAAATGVGLGQALSPEQLAALDAPMLWYVEQDVPDGAGGTVQALVPVVYLPALDRARLTNVAGGLVQGGDVSLDFTGRVTNTGYLAAERTLSVSASEFINAKRNADFGKQYQEIEGGWIDITGSRVQPGAFVTAAELQIRASRIESVSGEFEVLGADLAETQARSAAYLDQLRRDLGAGFVERQAQDDLHFEVHQKRKYDFASVAAMAVGIAVAVLTEGAGTFLLDLQAGSVAAAAADAAVSAMASSAASSVVTGDFAVKDVLRAGLAGGLTAGLSFGIGGQLGNVTLTGGNLVDGNLVRAANAATSLTDKLVGYAVRAGVSAGTQQLVYGDEAGNFGDALLNSFVASATADAANWVGANTPPQTLQNVLAHGAVGCAAAAAMGNDCLAGALGGMTSVVAAPLATQVMFGTAETDGLNNAQRAAIAGTSVLIAGLVAQTLDRSAADAGGAAANEVINNWLHPKEQTALKRAEAACAAGNAGACQLKLSLQRLDLGRENTDYARTSKGLLTAFVEAGSGMFLAPAQLATALVDGNLVDVAIATLKGAVDLPFEIASGLASGTPEVRGKALAQAVMLGVGVAQLGRVAATKMTAGPSIYKQSIGPANYTDDARIFTNFYSEGSAVDIGEHFRSFESGGSYLIPKGGYDAYVAGKAIVGRPDGQFMTSKVAMDDLLRQTGGSTELIKARLGIPPDAWMDPLIRIDILRPLAFNPRLPSGAEMGANSQFVRGGITSGRMPEIVTDQIPSSSITATQVIPTGVK
jgi:filamentous hemagglutinin